jgi:hypothetical protein
MTVAKCATFCGNSGYTLFGLEYYTEACNPTITQRDLTIQAYANYRYLSYSATAPISWPLVLYLSTPRIANSLAAATLLNCVEATGG